MSMFKTHKKIGTRQATGSYTSYASSAILEISSTENRKLVASNASDMYTQCIR